MVSCSLFLRFAPHKILAGGFEVVAVVVVVMGAVVVVVVEVVGVKVGLTSND